MERIEENMDKIRADMMDAEKALSGMEKCCGICVLPWKKYVSVIIFNNRFWNQSFQYQNVFFLNRNNAFKEDEGAWKGEGDGKVVNNQPQRVMMDGQQMMASGYIGKYVVLFY